MLLPLSERYLQLLGVEFQFQFQGLAASRTTLVNRVMFCGGYLHALGLTTCLGVIYLSIEYVVWGIPSSTFTCSHSPNRHENGKTLKVTWEVFKI